MPGEEADLDHRAGGAHALLDVRLMPDEEPGPWTNERKALTHYSTAALSSFPYKSHCKYPQDALIEADLIRASLHGMHYSSSG